MNVLITGSSGFIGKNLKVRLEKIKKYTVLEFNREHSEKDLYNAVKKAETIIHLAGENRPENIDAFEEVNHQLTKKICNFCREKDTKTHIIFSSSTQATQDNLYGKSKLAGEDELAELNNSTENLVNIFRFPGVFGKWCKPNYNSVVATFCNNIANNIPIKVNEKSTILNLIYIDDLVDQIIQVINFPENEIFLDVKSVHQKTLGEVSQIITSFKEKRTKLYVANMEDPFIKALYATYVTYLPKEDFSYDLVSHEDERGIFVEFLKSKLSGQVSFLTSNPGVIRGEHFHNTKLEKLLVIKGKARFRFRSLDNNEKLEIFTDQEKLQVVESIPGWAHDITNIGESEMIVLLWANEIFDEERPDTFSHEV